MSFQAVAWAMKQELPPLPKFVLVALCERANPDTGECWPGIKTLAEAVCLSERSVISYIAALVRNGFVDRQIMRGKDGRRRTNHYWVLFDRIDAPWIGPGGQVEEMPPSPEDDEASAAAESPPHANPAHCPNVKTASCGQGEPACTSHIEPEPSGIEPSESELVEGPAQNPVPPSTAPRGFDPNERQREIDRRRGAEEARRPKKVPVIRGSEPWKAWVAAGHSDTLHGAIEVNGRPDRGWYFDTLWPPKETGPPATGDPPPEAKKAG